LIEDHAGSPQSAAAAATGSSPTPPDAIPDVIPNQRTTSAPTDDDAKGPGDGLENLPASLHNGHPDDLRRSSPLANCQKSTLLSFPSVKVKMRKFINVIADILRRRSRDHLRSHLVLITRYNSAFICEYSSEGDIQAAF